ncbi:hypothetical protein L218DRAFT_957536 [Marasmius fiardii PR-910]|nr:hypothetical protein L218DRAFT_957536 [Marasmius fiardii PR-910]
MKFLTPTLLVAIAATSTAAQRASIGAPKNSTNVSANQTLLVEIDRPNFQSSATEVGIVIGIASCASGSGCIAPADGGIGTILYNGSFNPQFKSGSPLPPHQNFTVQISENIQKGAAQLSLTQFSLIGASLTPTTSFDIVSVNVV